MISCGRCFTATRCGTCIWGGRHSSGGPYRCGCCCKVSGLWLWFKNVRHESQSLYLFYRLISIYNISSILYPLSSSIIHHASCILHDHQHHFNKISLWMSMSAGTFRPGPHGLQDAGGGLDAQCKAGPHSMDSPAELPAELVAAQVYFHAGRLQWRRDQLGHSVGRQVKKAALPLSEALLGELSKM